MLRRRLRRWLSQRSLPAHADRPVARPMVVVHFLEAVRRCFPRKPSALYSRLSPLNRPSGAGDKARQRIRRCRKPARFTPRHPVHIHCARSRRDRLITAPDPGQVGLMWFQKKVPPRDEAGMKSSSV